MRSFARRLSLVTLLTFAAVGPACEGDDEGGLPADAPAGHSVAREGVAHAPGLGDPAASCAECHGADLRGGTGGEPSCFSCHGQEW